MRNHDIPFVYFDEFNWMRDLISAHTDAIAAELVRYRLQSGAGMAPITQRTAASPIHQIEVVDLTDIEEQSGESFYEDHHISRSESAETVIFERLNGGNDEAVRQGMFIGELEAEQLITINDGELHVTGESVSTSSGVVNNNISNSNSLKRKFDDDNETDSEDERNLDSEEVRVKCSLCLDRLPKFAHAGCGYMVYCNTCMTRSRRHKRKM